MLFYLFFKENFKTLVPIMFILGKEYQTSNKANTAKLTGINLDSEYLHFNV